MHMMSFEQAPPISVPMRFFLTAPVFGMLAGFVLLWVGPDALIVRWAPPTLAIAHLMTVGVMLQIMCGALLQFIPVATGGNIWRPNWIAHVVHPISSLAAIVLAAGFFNSNPVLLEVGASLFVVSLGVYGLAVGFAVFRTPAKNPTIVALRLAIVGLAATVGSGAILVETLQGRTRISVPQLAGVHAAWGLVGWALMLLMGVSFFVVPMLQMTPPYPKRLQQGVPPLLFVLLALCSAQLGWDTPRLWTSLEFAAVVLAAAAYALTTLWLRKQRQRKARDPTQQFFRLAMACILLAGASWALLAWRGPSAQTSPAALWLGALILQGVFASALCGMLYKIAPFATWMRLQKLDSTMSTKLNTRTLLPESQITLQLRLHGLALLALLAATVFPDLTRLAGVLTIASYAWLGWNLITVLRVYLRYRPHDRINPQITPVVSD